MSTNDCVKIATINAAKDVVIANNGPNRGTDVIKAAEDYLVGVFKAAAADCKATPQN